jgi:hypothetical protein
MILKTRKYDVNTSDGRFGLYVSKHSDGTCFAGVLWYRKAGSWAKGEEVTLDFDLKTFANTSEEAAFREAVTWVKKNLEGKAQFVERRK